tara:strand:+ start:17 stop:463 length:447 start_codon:yes stop_codon:yes gene_type:complete
MKIISHRGNTNGPDLSIENSPDQIDNCISLGYDVEIDLRIIDNIFYLGHDTPDYIIEFEWLLKNKNRLWIHCKNLESLRYLSDLDLNFFWHQSDDYTLTSKGYVWTYPGKDIISKSVIVMPEKTSFDFSRLKEYDVYGICTDYPTRIL